VSLSGRTVRTRCDAASCSLGPLGWSAPQHSSALANHRFTAFGSSGVILYQVSVAQVLGDSGTAIEYASKLHPAVIPPRSGKAGTGSTPPGPTTPGSSRLGFPAARRELEARRYGIAIARRN
jgi:hypothetical protein